MKKPKLTRHKITEPKLEPVTVDGDIVARRGVGARMKVQVGEQLIEVMILAPTAEAVRATCAAFEIECQDEHLGEALMVKPSFFDMKVRP